MGFVAHGAAVERYLVGDAKVTPLLADVPAAQRHRILTGMRWTVWLSAISIPFSYGSTILLARAGPEIVATYGLLGVYIAMILGLLYLGGDAVAIKFIPELPPEKRLAFFVSFFAIVCLSVVPWIIAASIWPRSLQYLLGKEVSPSFELVLLFLAPITILSSLVSAGLKAVLEIRWAQVIFRLATISSFLVYAGLFLFARRALAGHYPVIIWGTYLALCLLGAIAGLRHLWCISGWGRDWRSVRFFLPRGFWSYTLSLQQLSVLNMVGGRIDMILLLNFGGLTLLGKYVAVITLAEAIRMISNYFVGTLLPSLTNTLADGNEVAASSAFHTHARILFLVSMAATCGLILLAHPVTGLFGTKYTGLAPLIVLVALFIGVSTPGSMGGTLLSSIGKQQRAVYVGVGQLVAYLSLFAFLWPRYHLTGAVLAYGISWLVSNAALLMVARLNSPFAFSMARDYVVLAVVATASAIVTQWVTPGVVLGLALWTVALGLFLLLGRYSIGECMALLHCFMPIGRIAPDNAAVAASEP